MLDPYSAIYGGGMGMYGGYNPYLYGAGGFPGANSLMGMYGGANQMMMDYGMNTGMGAGMNGLLGGYPGLGSMTGLGGLGNSFGLMNPAAQLMTGNSMMNNNPAALGPNSNTNNFGSAGSPFGRQFRNRYTSGGVVTRENDGPNKSSGCGFIMKRGCNEIT
uniref:Uncharacterized protein n=1 Tax=Ditylenchus dipsaci TaxID=166011 RepID=A0A915DV60_9BILA